MTKLWIDLEGNLIPVADNLSHEEHAQAMGCDLEDLQAQGWVRIQNVPPPYLLIDFWLPLTAGQGDAVQRLFENRFSLYVVEFRGEARECGDGEQAMEYALSVSQPCL